MQKAPRVWQRVLALRCLWSVFLLGFCAPSCGFGQPKQESLSSVRERFGRQRLQTNAASTVSNFVKLSQDEAELLANISSAGKKRNWQAVKNQFSSYRGDGVPLYNAAMHAAIRCQAYQEGALIYQRCRKRCTVYQEPTFAAALRIFGKLGKSQKVRQVWTDALNLGCFNIATVSSWQWRCWNSSRGFGSHGGLRLGNRFGPCELGYSILLGLARRRSQGCKSGQVLLQSVATISPEAWHSCFLHSDWSLANWTIGWYSFCLCRDEISADSARLGFCRNVFGDPIAKDRKVILRTVDDAVEFLRPTPQERLQAAREALLYFDSEEIRLTALSSIIQKGLKRLYP